MNQNLSNKHEFYTWDCCSKHKDMLDYHTTKQSLQSFSGDLQISIFAEHRLLFAQFWTAYFHELQQNQPVSRHDSEINFISI